LSFAQQRTTVEMIHSTVVGEVRGVQGSSPRSVDHVAYSASYLDCASCLVRGSASQEVGKTRFEVSVVSDPGFAVQRKVNQEVVCRYSVRSMERTEVAVAEFHWSGPYMVYLAWADRYLPSDACRYHISS